MVRSKVKFLDITAKEWWLSWLQMQFASPIFQAPLVTLALGVYNPAVCFETKNRRKFMGPHIVVIGGSVRPQNYTWMALSLVAEELVTQKKMDFEVIDPRELNLAKPGLESNPQMEALRKTVSEATGVILATPEYHGSVSSVMKQVIENLGFPSVLAGKPVALLGVAAGQIGAIKSLEQLRSICSHIGAIVIPYTVSVANVQKVFDAHGKCQDAGIEKRIRGVAKALMDYIEHNICPRVALEQMVRENAH